MIIQRFPANSTPRYPIKRFSAPMILGQYDFGISANTDQVMLELQSDVVYAITNMSFFAQGGQDSWLTAMDTEVNFPAFTLRVSNSNAPIYSQPLRCVDFLDSVETSVYFKTDRVPANLLISFRGIINSLPAYVAAGLDPLAAVVDLSIMEISNKEWVTAYNTGKLPKF